MSTNQMWQDKLMDTERQALVLMRVYEHQRQESGQWGYQAAPLTLQEEIVNHPIFKTFETVASWIVEKGFNITWSEAHWVGLVKFIFQKLHPAIPQPGQLKNAILLKQYILSGAEPVDRTKKTEKELEEMYLRIIRPEIKQHAAIMTQLGLKEFTLCPQQQQLG